MKTKILKRALIGAPIGVTISVIISIIISLFKGDGSYHAIPPQLTNVIGNEITSFIVQTLCTMLYGAVWAGASAIWDNEKWSILRQTVTHLVVCSISSFPIAYFMQWMEHSLRGILCYCAIFLFIYAVIWFSQYSALKRRIDDLNRDLRSR